MDTKENKMVSNSMVCLITAFVASLYSQFDASFFAHKGFTVKSEPREVSLPSITHAAESSRPVKGEPTDDARMVSHIFRLSLSVF